MADALDSARWQRLKTLLADAAELDANGRADLLDTLDDDLRAELADLLDAHDEADTLGRFETPVLGVRAFEPDARIGPYRLVEEIGRGGMGTVYRAERADGQFEQAVALKVLPPALGASAERFRAERQILAHLDHPHVARLLDGGVTDAGPVSRDLPWLAMELVEGEPLTEFAERRGLGVEDRLHLFLQVTDAVAYAHRRLVVHRDLKPSNVLVTDGGADGEPSAKLLDFGIAKLLDPDASGLIEDGGGRSPASLPLTRTGVRPMTPEYAAPEQVREEPITTATDVYALGVLLFELLTGRRPYDLAGRSPAEVERIVCESVPPKPSAIADEARAQRLRGDLDTIVGKALAKDPARRYAGAEALADDLRRYLDGLPVLARPATAGYRARKFVERHRAATAAAVLVLLAVFGGSGVALWQAAEAARARDRAEERFGIAQDAARAMLYDVHDAVAGLEGATAAREVIVARSLAYLDRLSEGAGDDPALRLDLAAAYLRIANVQGNPTDHNLGRTADALASFRRGLALLPDPADLPDSLATQALLTGGRLHEKLGATLAHAVAPDSALPHLDRALAHFRRALDLAPDDPERTTYLATGHINRADYTGHPYFPNVGRPDSAFSHYEHARELLEKIPEARASLFAQRMLAITYEREGTLFRDLGHLDDALEPTRRALGLRLRIAERSGAGAEARRDVGVSHEALGRLYLDTGRTEDGLRELEAAFAIYADLEEADPESVVAQQTLAFGHFHLGRALAQATRTDEARHHLDEAVRLFTALAEGEPGSARRRSLVEMAEAARAEVG